MQMEWWNVALAFAAVLLLMWLLARALLMWVQPMCTSASQQLSSVHANGDIHRGKHAAAARAYRNVAVFVTAHPDDESMFFLPTIRAFLSRSASEAGNGDERSSSNSSRGRSSGWNGDVHLLCLSTGNADGLGPVRVKELEQCARVIGIDPRNVVNYQSRVFKLSCYAFPSIRMRMAPALFSVFVFARSRARKPSTIRVCRTA